MHVCFCFNLNDKKIKEYIDSGCDKLSKLQKVCAAGTNCGGCIRHVQEILNHSKKRTREEEEATV